MVFKTPRQRKAVMAKLNGRTSAQARDICRKSYEDDTVHIGNKFTLKLDRLSGLDLRRSIGKKYKVSVKDHRTGRLHTLVTTYDLQWAESMFRKSVRHIHDRCKKSCRVGLRNGIRR